MNLFIAWDFDFIARALLSLILKKITEDLSNKTRKTAKYL